MKASPASGGKSSKRISSLKLQLNHRSGPAAFSFESKAVYEKKYADLEKQKKLFNQTAHQSKIPVHAEERSSSPPTPSRSRSQNTSAMKIKASNVKKTIIAASPFDVSTDDLFFPEFEDNRSSTPIQQKKSRTKTQPKPAFDVKHKNPLRGSEDNGLEAFLKKGQEIEDPHLHPTKKKQAIVQWFKDPLDPKHSFSSTLFQKHELEAMFNTLVNESLAKPPDNSKDIQKSKTSNTSPIESRFESFMEKLEQDKDKSSANQSFDPTLLKSAAEPKASSSFGIGPLLKAFVSVENSFINQIETFAHPDANSTDLSITDLVNQHNEKLLRDRTFRKVLPARSQSPILQKDLYDSSNPLTPEKDQNLTPSAWKKKSDTTIPRLDLTTKLEKEKNTNETDGFTFKGGNSGFGMKNLEPALEFKSNLVSTNETSIVTIELQAKIAALTKQTVVLSGIIDDKDTKIRETQRAFEELEEKYHQQQSSFEKEQYEQEITNLTTERDNLRKELNDVLSKLLEAEPKEQETSFLKREQESFTGRERSRFLSDVSEEAEIKKLGTDTKKSDKSEEYILQKRIKELEKELWMEKEMNEKLQQRLSAASAEITAHTNKMMEELIREVVLREEDLKNDLKKYLSELQNKIKENQALRIEREALSEKINEVEQKSAGFKANMVSMQNELIEMQEHLKMREHHMLNQVGTKQKEAEGIAQEMQLLYQQNQKMEEDFGVYRSKMESGLAKLDKERKELKIMNKEYEEENINLKKKIASLEESKKNLENQTKSPAEEEAKTPRRKSNLDPTLNISGISYIPKDTRSKADGLKKCLTDFNGVLAELNSFLASIKNVDTALDKPKLIEDGNKVKDRLREEISQFENEIVIVENQQMDEELSEDGFQLRDKAFTLGMPMEKPIQIAANEDTQNAMKMANKRASLREDQPQAKFVKKNLTVKTGDENGAQTKEEKLEKIKNEKQVFKMRETLANARQELIQTNDPLKKQAAEEKVRNIEMELGKLTASQPQANPPENKVVKQVTIPESLGSTTGTLNTTATLIPSGIPEEMKDETIKHRSDTQPQALKNDARPANRRKTLRDLAREMEDEKMQMMNNSTNQKGAAS